MSIRPSHRSVSGLLLAIALSAPVASAQEADKPSDALYSSAVVDLGVVVSDLDRSAKWYAEALGLKELPGFEVPGDFGHKIGLTNKLPIKVKVFALGDDEKATRIKLMQFKSAPGARVDQTFVHSTYGFRYLTLFVNDIDKSLAKAAEQGAKPIGEGVQPLPEGFPEGIFIAVIRDPDGNFVEFVGPKGK